MKKIIIGLAVVLLVFLGWYYFKPKTLGERSDGGGGSSVDAITLNGAGVATTTEAFIPSTATSTYAFSIEGASSVDLNIQFNASTTASKLVWLVEFSHNKIDWYQEDIASVAGSVITHNATASNTAFTYHTWTPASAGISRKNITITPTASRYMRVQFVTWGANGSIWSQAILN